MGEDALETATVVRALDALEDRADGYVTLAECEKAVGRSVEPEIDAGVVLIDYRARADGTTVIVCRLNRRDPVVQRLVGW